MSLLKILEDQSTVTFFYFLITWLNVQENALEINSLTKNTQESNILNLLSILYSILFIYLIFLSFY